MLTRNELLKALVEHGREKLVSEVMHKTFEKAEAGEPLGKVFERLQNCDCHSLPVMEQGRLVGVIDMENVGEFIALRSAIRSHA
jgi:Mg/Co/Ni transporter MgtE